MKNSLAGRSVRSSPHGSESILRKGPEQTVEGEKDRHFCHRGKRELLVSCHARSSPATAGRDKRHDRARWNSVRSVVIRW
eukprot:7339229-Prymnesium_polylepis.1